MTRAWGSGCGEARRTQGFRADGLEGVHRQSVAGDGHRRPALCLMLAVASALLMPATVEAYRLRVNGQEYLPGDGANPRILSALGEPRTAKAMEGPDITRFHTGVDIPLESGKQIQPIEIGTVARIQPYGDESYIDIRGVSGRTFRYLHVDPAPGLKLGTTVYTDTTIPVLA